MRYFFVDPSELGKQTPLVVGSEARHIIEVLRLGPGDRIGLLDGRGNGYEAEITFLCGRDVGVTIVAASRVARESPVDIVVVQALLKDKKMDRLVRHLTELGIAQWRPVTTERCVPRPQVDRLQARLQRWEKIAVEAMKQCRRGRAPKIFAPVSLPEFLGLDLECRLKIALWESEKRSLPQQLPPVSPNRDAPDRILLLLGPEGGFSRAEVDAAAACGFVTASLGPRVLRAETATIAAVTLVQYLFGDMGDRLAR